VELQSEVVAIATELMGVVKRTYVADGDHVKAGNPLFALDDRDYRAALENADAQIAVENAALNSVERQLEAQDAVIAGQNANLEAAEAQHQLTRATRRRDAILASSALISRQTFEIAVIDDLKGQAGVSAAMAALSEARRQREVLIAQRMEQRARLAAARSGRQRSAIALDRCVIRAPIDATVLKVNIHAGEYARPQPSNARLRRNRGVSG